MDEETAAFCQKIAPKDKRAEWHQRGVKRVLLDWKVNRPDDFDLIVDGTGFGMLVGYNIYPSEIGQYGYDTGFHFSADIETEFVDDVPGGHLAEEFYTEWVSAIQTVIEEEQQQSIFSPKEFATFFGYRHPRQSEQQNADALRITVGTFRGKVGRVKSKIETVQQTQSLLDATPVDVTGKEWSLGSYNAPFSVIDRVDEERLPLDTVDRVATKGISIDDLPVDELIIDE